MDFFEHLDREGGFFYERWGDAPVHSIAASLLLNKEEVHFFNDIAYYHVPFTHCPTSDKVRVQKKCHCNPKENFDWKGYSCTYFFTLLSSLLSHFDSSSYLACFFLNPSPRLFHLDSLYFSTSFYFTVREHDEYEMNHPTDSVTEYNRHGKVFRYQWIGETGWI